ncbi:MAG: ABC transporter substrate-binding protein [Solobacterium sp.]|nr:ABC transporter substrate-binding protein [Solobacterium sp.]
MKKAMTTILSAAALLIMTGCSSTPAPAGNPTAAPETAAAEPAETTSYRVAVVKQLDHASLDEIANAVTAQLDAIAEKEGIAIEYDVYSGQNDQTVLKQIGDQAVSDHVDAIIPIATLAAVTMTACAEESGIPVIFAAVSDPESAELTGIDYVSGTSDALNAEQIIDMMIAQDPDLITVGLLYSKSETNSQKPIADAKAYLDGKGIEYIEATGNTRDEVIAAVSSLIASGVSAIFTPTDNVIMDAELTIAETLIEAGIPHYAGADSFVRNGAFATCGVNYTDLGKRTADIAYDAIVNGTGSLEDYYLMEGGIVTVNTETAEALNLGYEMFSQYGEVVEVITTAE